MGVGSFLPAGEDAAEAVEPGVAAFDDPAAGAEAGLAFDRLCLFAAAADVGGEREFLGELTDLVVVVGGVEAEPVRRLPASARAVRSGCDSIVLRASLWSFRFAPAGAIPIGTPLPSVRSDRFAPF